MILGNIGYMINEASAIAGFDKVNIITEDNGKLIAEGILQTAEETNRNGRFYRRPDLAKEIASPRLNEILESGYLRSELGHPITDSLLRQSTIDDERTCAQFLKIWMEGNNVWARFRGTNNEFGRVFNEDLKDGCLPAWSLRALGNLVKTSHGTEVRDLKVITWDKVIFPSHPSAYTKRIINADYEKQNNLDATASSIHPFDTDEVVNYIKSESANIKYIKENFDFMYDEIKVSPEGDKVTLMCEDGNVIVVNLERHISNELMNYASSRLI